MNDYFFTLIGEGVAKGLFVHKTMNALLSQKLGMIITGNQKTMVLKG